MLFGIVSVPWRFVHSWNALSPIVLRLEPRVIVPSNVFWINALLPIEIVESGITILPIGAISLYVASTSTFAVPIVNVVSLAVASANDTPPAFTTHLSNSFPCIVWFAVTVTVVPFTASDKSTVPPFTVIV